MRNSDECLRFGRVYQNLQTDLAQTIFPLVRTGEIKYSMKYTDINFILDARIKLFNYSPNPSSGVIWNSNLIGHNNKKSSLPFRGEMKLLWFHDTFIKTVFFCYKQSWVEGVSISSSLALQSSAAWLLRTGRGSAL